MLRDVSERDLSIELFGNRYPTPLIAAPIGVLELGSLDALPAIVSRVAGRVPVLFDGGIRSGSDVLIALALGAAVLVGRPWVYGLAIGGAPGAEAVLRNLLADFDLALGLSGHTSAAELDARSLVRAGREPRAAGIKR
jgi:isopentenyl diphosphate isomerase/L-lactate dehydrogenase-like FMN-dependent dehydrogenase